MIPRIFKAPATGFFLFGPRGTGKSTWLHELFPDAVWVDLLLPDVFRTYSAKPERLSELVRGQKLEATVVVDEIQKIPELLSVVHALIEEKKGKRFQFVLTGSSARKLRRAGTDLLAGRVLLRSLYPFMATELENEFKLEKALQQGLLPLVVNAPDPSDVLKTYIALYLREEVKMEGLVRNVGNFSRFLEAISFSHASMLNVSNVARECEVERKTVEGYVNILEDLLLSFRLPVFSKRAKRATAAHDKFYIFDAGVYRTLRPSGPLDRSEEIDGCALEGLVAQHLVAWAAYRGTKNNLYYWRTRKGVEVDLVLYGPDGFWAFEIKNSSRVRPEDLRGLRAFSDDYPESKTILLYRGRERLKKDNILCLPCEDFLRSLHPSRLPDV